MGNKATWVLAALVTGLLAVTPALAGEDRSPGNAGGQGIVQGRLCHCSNHGERVPVGELRCLTINGKAVMARCEMQLNNTSWRLLHEACPSA